MIEKAYFSEGKDIGQPEILSELLQELGIAPEVLPNALNDHVCQTRIQENAQKAEGKEYGINIEQRTLNSP